MNLQKLENELDKLFEETISIIVKSKKLSKKITRSSKLIISSLKNDGKLVSFGNGGSAADAQHFVAEFVGRFQKERNSLPAIAFTTDTSIITSIGNDYSFDQIFKRQCESLVNNNDVVLAISTSGNSKNVIAGVKMAKRKGAKIIGLTGKNKNQLVQLSDIAIQVPSNSTPRIQEVHRLILHSICQIVENEFVGS